MGRRKHVDGSPVLNEHGAETADLRAQMRSSSRCKPRIVGDMRDRSPDRPLDLLPNVQLVCAVLSGAAGDTTGRDGRHSRGAEPTVRPFGPTTELTAGP